jgi:hypothetical protein
LEIFIDVILPLHRRENVQLAVLVTFYQFIVDFVHTVFQCVLSRGFIFEDIEAPDLCLRSKAEYKEAYKKTGNNTKKSHTI